MRERAIGEEREELEAGRLEEEPGEKMTFLEHLDELRRRLVHIVLYIAVGFAICMFFHRQIYDFLAAPITKLLAGDKLVFTKPTEPFTLYMKVSLLAGIFLTAPLTLYEVWLFISPGLYRHEKRYAVPFLVSSFALFVSGGAFAYYVVLEPAYRFLLEIGGSFRPMITINDYWDITSTIMLGFGLVFEMPVVVAFLSMFGLVTPGFLWRNLRYAIFIIAVAAALLSPTGDAFTMTIYAAPMLVLYLISIGVSWLCPRP